MGPALLAALGMGGLTGLNEMTTGQDKRNRDAILKATAYRMAAYDKSINPDKYEVYTPDPLGKGIQAGGGAYQMASSVQNDDAIRNFFNAKGAQAGGIGSSMADAENASDIGAYQNLDGPPNQEYFNGVHSGDSNWKDDSAYNRLRRAQMMGSIG
jgi:hypothetical protein